MRTMYSEDNPYYHDMKYTVTLNIRLPLFSRRHCAAALYQLCHFAVAKQHIQCVNYE